ncbi:GAF domain-containing protein [Marinigracilibium pacificum]|uniref:GAF domain-containing protein n=1 Tax=Marinigracilibium pacificum TaxID=2729599 RepID=A0A848J186_9BACT|nr:GAF domain-containing protein [Marinigracilibium pacificum]NMM48244.1 GAF domain-containing protein [Marinigracilibium pacificum]
MKISDLRKGKGISPILLAEAEDKELKALVKKAAFKLGAPIAMVNLLLDHIQYFRAHYGLPKDLEIARGTNRDVSFCQFVVNKGSVFEVNDAENDKRIPQHLVKEYGIRSYLGIPITARNEIVGSLCVIDTVPRKFTMQEQEVLSELSTIVNKKFEKIITKKEKERPNLLEKNICYALEEIKTSISPIEIGINNGFNFVEGVKSFLRLSEHKLNGNSVPTSSLLSLLEAAKKSLYTLENDLYNMDAAYGDTIDSIKAMENLYIQSNETYLMDIAESGRELSRHLTRDIGGVYLPDIEENLRLSVNKQTGIALISNSLIHMAGVLLTKNEYSGGIRMNLSDLEHEACVSIQANEFEMVNSKDLAKTLNLLVHDDPSVDVITIPNGIELRFSILK